VPETLSASNFLSASGLEIEKADCDSAARNEADGWLRVMVTESSSLAWQDWYRLGVFLSLKPPKKLTQ